MRGLCARTRIWERAMVIDATRIFRCPDSFVSVKQAGVSGHLLRSANHTSFPVCQEALANLLVIDSGGSIEHGPAVFDALIFAASART